jgi:hypothetical protein
LVQVEPLEQQSQQIQQMEIMVVTVEPQHLVLGYLLLGAVEALVERLQVRQP